jgi:hypothetical protein
MPSTAYLTATSPAATSPARHALELRFAELGALAD